MISKLLLGALLFSLGVQAKELKEFHLVSGCKIFSFKGKLLKSFPGEMCIFLDNGNFVSATSSSIRMLNTKSQILWEREGHFHHQLNLTNDKKRILALSSKVDSDKEGPYRQDFFLILNLEGQVLHEQQVTNLYKQHNPPVSNKRPLDNLWSAAVNAKYEISHFNSFYEIPSVSAKNAPRWMKEGNIILNGKRAGVYIVSPDLKKVIHSFTLEDSLRHNIHDVQVTNKGHLLFFNNRAKNKGKPQGSFYSSVMELDSSLRKVNIFEAKPRTIFYSLICGSIQEIDEDTWLFTHYLNGSYFYSKSKREIISAVPSTHLGPNFLPTPTQQSKAFELTAFLSYWP